MAFSEQIKLEVKKKAMFQCCRCRATGIDAHHIIPQHEGGPDTIDNAAPLCQNCHDQFGDNPVKRKELRQMRDHWYETVKAMYSSQVNAMYPLLEKINDGIDEIKSNQAHSGSQVEVIKTQLKKLTSLAIDRMTSGTAAVTASNLTRASGASLSNQRLDDMSEIVMCSQCGQAYLLFKENPTCPHCGQVYPY